MTSKLPRTVRTGAGLFRTLADLLDGGEPLVLVTVIEASGSAPGKAAAKMVVTADALHGTVGGGRVENAAIQHARTLLAKPAGPETVRYDVVQDLGMSCGGTMHVLFEPMTPLPRLVVFGAGHISETLCRIAASTGFEVVVCDEREDWLTEERFPDARERILAPWEDAVEKAHLTAETFVASVSPGHALDERVVTAILGSAVRPRYLGVVGSRRKAALLKKGLLENGQAQADVERIRIPMGLNIGAVDPREIALSVVAEMVAVLRGVESVEPW
jgi:xanthine dehydrogenase accessory factor